MYSLTFVSNIRPLPTQQQNDNGTSKFAVTGMSSFCHLSLKIRSQIFIAKEILVLSAGK